MKEHLRAMAAVAALTVPGVVLPGVAGAQEASSGGFALNPLQPSPAGDVFFGVPAPYAYGHLAPNAYLLFDYAHRPIRLASAEDVAIVSSQGFLRLDASLALWERLLVSVDVPLSVVQSGDDPAIAGTTFTALEAPRAGDVRIGLRGRLFGDDGGPFQLGLGGYFFAPSGSSEQYTGEGAVRGAFHALVGGRLGSPSVGFVYNATAGAELRASDRPHAITYGAGAALLLADDLVQIGPEVYAVTPLGGDLPLSSVPVTTAPAGTNAELLGSVKLRFLGGLTVGAAVGPGLGSAVGTPTFRAIGMIGWTPLPPARVEDDGDEVALNLDRDDDGIPDAIDACPEVPGEPSADPTKDGCPPSDRDGDGVPDGDDACPTTPGLPSDDLTKNGCPPDSDGDGFHDGIDACPDVAGGPSADPKLRGCPGDLDGDGIPDAEDRCPKAAGERNEDPARHGCPADPDGDGILWAADACPNDRGDPDPDPKKNGCPKFVRVDEGEILISKSIEFSTYGDSLGESVTPDSEEVLREVAEAIKARPEIVRVEVQGHTDDSGDEPYNLDLSQRRAESVRKWLIEKGGVPADKLVAKGYGFSRPIADNRVRTGRQKNRRVQFVILDKK
jgi:OmpA-OmpF porin, OOP family